MVHVRALVRAAWGMSLCLIGHTGCASWREPGKPSPTAVSDTMPAGAGGEAMQGGAGGSGGRVDALPNAAPQEAWTGVVPCAQTPGFWPMGARAAVSLTYDDAMTSPLRHALPGLDSRGWKATFYLTTRNLDADRWRPLARSGHELASHSVTHKSGITNAAMENEVLASLATIRGLGVVQPKFSFAYPNGSPTGSDGPYQPMVLKHTLAARGLDGRATKPSAKIDWGNVSSRILEAEDNVVGVIADTLAQNAWMTFVVHGIEDDAYLNIPKAKHDELLAVLDQQGKDVWVAPFITVADYIQRCY